MTYELAIGDRAYSSWSLRGWLLFDAFGLKVRARTARLYTDALLEIDEALKRDSSEGLVSLRDWIENEAGVGR